MPRVGNWLVGYRAGIKRLLRRLRPGIDDVTFRQLAREWTRWAWERQLDEGHHWLGFPIYQWPTDLMVLQEIICEQRPKAIVETGTWQGGSAVLFASLLKLLGGGRVVSVDIEHPSRLRQSLASSPFGDQITLITGDSVSPESITGVREAVGGEQNTLVVLDSLHTYEHVLAELRAYSEFVPPGGYLIVLDTICYDLWDLPRATPRWRSDNALRSVETFLVEHFEFEVDQSRERYLVTAAPQGFLRRKKQAA
jgi:cephalosporin hydroxylase